MPAFLYRAQGTTVAGREVFETGDHVVGLFGDKDSVNHLLSDRVVFHGQLGNIAMIRLECFV